MSFRFHERRSARFAAMPGSPNFGLEPRVPSTKDPVRSGAGGLLPTLKNNRNNVLTFNRAGSIVLSSNKDNRPGGTRNLERRKYERSNQSPKPHRGKERPVRRVHCETPVQKRSPLGRQDSQARPSLFGRHDLGQVPSCVLHGLPENRGWESRLVLRWLRKIHLHGAARRCQTASGRIPKSSFASLDAERLHTSVPQKAKRSPRGCSASATTPLATASSSLVRWAAGAGVCPWLLRQTSAIKRADMRRRASSASNRRLTAMPVVRLIRWLGAVQIRACRRTHERPGAERSGRSESFLQKELAQAAYAYESQP
jgi:hypothetical protein